MQVDGQRWVLVALMAAAVFVMAALWVLPRLVHRSPICERNVGTLGVALKSYARSHNGRYPASLTAVVGALTTDLPQCDRVGRDTYSSGYIVSTDFRTCTLECSDERWWFQQGLKASLLRFDSAAGGIVIVQ